MNPDEIPQSPLHPSHDYVVLALVKPKGSSLLSTTGEECDIYVAAVGPGRLTDQVGPDGKLLLSTPSFKRGQRVHIDSSKAMKLEVYGHRFLVLNHFNILGVVDESVEEWMKSNPEVHLPTSTILPNLPPQHRRGGKN